MPLIRAANAGLVDDIRKSAVMIVVDRAGFWLYSAGRGFTVGSINGGGVSPHQDCLLGVHSMFVLVTTDRASPSCHSPNHPAGGPSAFVGTRRLWQ